jgi:hypothetical protein
MAIQLILQDRFITKRSEGQEHSKGEEKEDHQRYNGDSRRKGRRRGGGRLGRKGKRNLVSAEFDQIVFVVQRLS